MRNLSQAEKEKIWMAKRNWERDHKRRKLYSCFSFSDVRLLAELSDFANNLEKK